MDPFDALVAEAKDALTPWVFAALIVVALLSRVLPGVRRERMRATVVLFALHVVLLVATAALVSAENESAREARIAARVLLAMTAVGIGGTLVFGILLGRTRIRVARIVQDLVVAGITLVVVGVVLSKMGVALAGLFATSAVLTAVVGFSLQETLGNTIGGLALQADGSVNVGDFVRVGDVMGRVSEIRWRFTAIETGHWETVLVPNGVLMKGPVTVIGRRHGQPRQWRRQLWFNVDFRTPPSEVIDTVVRAVRDQPLDHVAKDPAPLCLLMELGESTGRYALRYWLTEFKLDDVTDSLVRTRLVFALRRAGIPLSMPAHAVFLTEESTTRREQKTEEETRQRVAALRAVDVLAPLDDAEVATLAHDLHAAPFMNGEVITKQGSQAHWLYIVDDGEVAVHLAKDGVENEIARMGRGSFFGEMSLMTGEPRRATVVAVTDVRCWRLDKEAFRALVKRRPDVAEPIAQLPAERNARVRAVEDDLSAEARAQRRKDEGHDLFNRMRSFFGLE